ncbi:MAG: hypothetical protein WAM14_20080 [Candidatus Nitrosopolaris sp.]
MVQIGADKIKLAMDRQFIEKFLDFTYLDTETCHSYRIISYLWFNFMANIHGKRAEVASE